MPPFQEAGSVSPTAPLVKPINAGYSLDMDYQCGARALCERCNSSKQRYLVIALQDLRLLISYLNESQKHEALGDRDRLASLLNPNVRASPFFVPRHF